MAMSSSLCCGLPWRVLCKHVVPRLHARVAREPALGIVPLRRRANAVVAIRATNLLSIANVSSFLSSASARSCARRGERRATQGLAGYEEPGHWTLVQG